MRVIERRDGSGLTLEALGKRRGDDLDRHLAPEAGVPGAVDLTHAAAPRGPTISYGPSRVPAVSIHAAPMARNGVTTLARADARPGPPGS